MNQQLTPETIAELQAKFPVVEELSTREERLNHWASLVEKHQGNLRLFHLLERMTDQAYRATTIAADNNAFWLAIMDPAFQKAGLAIGTTFAGLMQFFNLSKAQLHEFSCDCGGAISNTDMAARIRKIAGRPAENPEKPGFFARMIG